MVDTPPPAATNQKPLEDRVGQFCLSMFCWESMAGWGGGLGANPVIGAAPGIGRGLFDMVGGKNSVMGTCMGLSAMAAVPSLIAGMTNDQQNQQRNIPLPQRAPTPSGYSS